MESLEELVRLYGIAVVFAGTFFEGETIVIIAGFLAHQGIIHPYLVAASAFAGSFLGDQLWFYLGRRHAAHPLVMRITDRPLFKKALNKIAEHQTIFILSFRFVYGIRTVSPVALGLSQVTARQFLLLNAIAAAVWAIAFTLLGYLFGQAVETYLGKIKGIEQKLLLGAACALALYGAYRLGLYLWRRHRGAEGNGRH
jgi:membrane protein DedA with SNARE-associated domain